MNDPWWKQSQVIIALSAILALVIMCCICGFVSIGNSNSTKASPMMRRLPTVEVRYGEFVIPTPIPTPTLTPIPTPTPIPEPTVTVVPVPVQTSAPAPIILPPPPEEDPEPVDEGTVHAGAFCAHPGATGHTSTGKLLVCKRSATDSRDRWR